MGTRGRRENEREEQLKVASAQGRQWRCRVDAQGNYKGVQARRLTPSIGHLLGMCMLFLISVKGMLQQCWGAIAIEEAQHDTSRRADSRDDGPQWVQARSMKCMGHTCLWGDLTYCYVGILNHLGWHGHRGGQFGPANELHARIHDVTSHLLEKARVTVDDNRTVFGNLPLGFDRDDNVTLRSAVATHDVASFWKTFWNTKGWYIFLMILCAICFTAFNRVKSGREQFRARKWWEQIQRAWNNWDVADIPVVEQFSEQTDD